MNYMLITIFNDKLKVRLNLSYCHKYKNLIRNQNKIYCFGGGGYRRITDIDSKVDLSNRDYCYEINQNLYN